MMKKLSLFLFCVVLLSIIGCVNEPDVQVDFDPLKELAQIDGLLLDIADSSKVYIVPTDSISRLTGVKGTVIHVNPQNLETLDGSPLDETIEVELLEMTDKSSLLLNNAQTVSNGQILISGGAYYLNMTSSGKQLKIKKGKGIDVEFPRLSDESMALFKGERDSTGQMNWIQTQDSLQEKEFVMDVVPIPPSEKDTSFITSEFYYDSDLQREMPIIRTNEMTEEEYQIKLAEYEERKAQIELENETYQSISILEFGWINCDRLFKKPGLKTNINLFVNESDITSARFYAVFEQYRSVMSCNYWSGIDNSALFRNVPIGEQLKIIAIGFKDKEPLYFEISITAKKPGNIDVEFANKTQAEIKAELIKIKTAYNNT